MPADPFFDAFYLDPAPRIAGEALLRFVETSRPLSPGVLAMFARATQLSQEVRAEFVNIRDREPGAAAAITRIFTSAADPSFPNAATLELSLPEHLDFVWGEFLLTGAEAPVRRIASVLQWDDRLLAALVAWASQSVYMPWTRSARARAKAELLAKNIVVEPGLPQFGNSVDLDLWVWKLMADGFKIREQLPFAVPDALIMHMAVKGAACWSMQSNANTHQVVRAIYDTLPNRDRLPPLASTPLPP